MILIKGALEFFQTVFYSTAFHHFQKFFTQGCAKFDRPAPIGYSGFLILDECCKIGAFRYFASRQAFNEILCWENH